MLPFVNKLTEEDEKTIEDLGAFQEKIEDAQKEFKKVEEKLDK